MDLRLGYFPWLICTTTPRYRNSNIDNNKNNNNNPTAAPPVTDEVD